MSSTVISKDPFVVEVPAQSLRVGKQLLTKDGWQTIKGMIVFDDPNQVDVFTAERDDETSDGWKFQFGDPAQTRLVPTAEQEYQRKRKERLAARQQRRLVRDAAGCPSWCTTHDNLEDERPRNHSGEPVTAEAANLDTGQPLELCLWLERRDDRETGETETVGVLEFPAFGNLEFTPAGMRDLASRLMSLADRAAMSR